LTNSDFNFIGPIPSILQSISRKRGERAKRRGLSAEQIPVLVVRDHSGQQALAEHATGNPGSGSGKSFNLPV
jgi:hypothetical protein